MGMGEPLHNVDALIRALDVLCDPAGLGVAPTRITVSTAGHLARSRAARGVTLVPELAVSVNGATDGSGELMPVGRMAARRAARGPRALAATSAPEDHA